VKDARRSETAAERLSDAEERLIHARPRPVRANLQRVSGTPGHGGSTPSESAFEVHFSVEDLALTWAVSEDFVRRLFLHEPGVVVFWRNRPGKRVYRTVRIPASVAARVHKKMTKE
jgi:hypothetical protein